MRLLALCLVAFLSVTNSYKILVYNSKYGHSHSNFLGMIADTLADAGHNVTSLIPIMDKTVKDGTEKSHKIYVEADPVIEQWYEDQKSGMPMNMFELRPMNPLMPFFMGPMLSKLFYLGCKKVIAEPGLLERLKAEKYDVYISENFDVCGMGLSASIQPKSVIGTTASSLFAQQFAEFGVEPATSYRPVAFTSKLNVHSTFSRLLNLYASALSQFSFSFSRRSVNQALKESFGDDYPTVAEQSANVAYVFTNSEPLLDFAGPTTARVVDIPGIGAKTPKPLDEYWLSVLTRRKQTVLLSFGSMAKSITLPERMKMGIIKAISSFPEITFIWKYENPEDDFCKEHASKLDNLVLTKWMPQVDILNSEHLSLFITHGGMGSSQETAFRGVPGIFIPLFGDQPRNAGMMEYNGFGKVYDKFDLADGDKLTATIKEVLGDKKYRDNAKRISKMLAKKPFSSKEQLIKTVEFAAEFGPSAALRPQSIDMSFVDYHNLDVFALLMIIFLVVIYAFAKITKAVVRKIVCRKSKAKSE